jgi:cobalamin synthase
VAALSALTAGGWRWVVLAPALARWPAVALGRALPYARPGGGLGSAVTEGSGRLELAGASALAAAAAIGLVGWAGLVACAVTLIVTLGWGLVCRRRIGGVTGDTLGAAIELAEIAVLVTAVAFA